MWHLEIIATRQRNQCLKFRIFNSLNFSTVHVWWKNIAFTTPCILLRSPEYGFGPWEEQGTKFFTSMGNEHLHCWEPLPLLCLLTRPDFAAVSAFKGAANNDWNKMVPLLGHLAALGLPEYHFIFSGNVLLSSLEKTWQRNVIAARVSGFWFAFRFDICL